MKKWASYDQKFIMVSNESTLYLLSDFNGTWIFSTGFFFQKNTQTPNLMKIHPVGAELLLADRHDEANSRFSQFYERA